ncbi:unnamed protein product, partial [Citrullus colocynthis]
DDVIAFIGNIRIILLKDWMVIFFLILINLGQRIIHNHIDGFHDRTSTLVENP